MGLPSLLLLALAAGGSASVLPLAPRNKGFLSFPIVHERRHERILFRRDEEVKLYNHTTLAYMIDRMCPPGDPPKPQPVTYKPL